MSNKNYGKKLLPLTEENKKYLGSIVPELHIVAKRLTVVYKNVDPKEIDSIVNNVAVRLMCRNIKFDDFCKSVYNLARYQINGFITSSPFQLPECDTKDGHKFIDVPYDTKEPTFGLDVRAVEICEHSFSFVDGYGMEWIVTDNKKAEDNDTIYLPPKTFEYTKCLCVYRFSLDDISTKYNVKRSSILSILQWYINVLPSKMEKKRKLRGYSSISLKGFPR